MTVANTDECWLSFVLILLFHVVLWYQKDPKSINSMLHIEVSTFILKFLVFPDISWFPISRWSCLSRGHPSRESAQWCVTSTMSRAPQTDQPGSGINDKSTRPQLSVRFCSNSVRSMEIKRTQSVWQKRNVRNSDTKKMHQRYINEQAQRYHLPRVFILSPLPICHSHFYIWLSHRDRTNETTWKHPFYDYFVGITRRGVTPFEVGYVRKVFVISVISVIYRFLSNMFQLVLITDPNSLLFVHHGCLDVNSTTSTQNIQEHDIHFASAKAQLLNHCRRSTWFRHVAKLQWSFGVSLTPKDGIDRAGWQWSKSQYHWKKDGR